MIIAFSGHLNRTAAEADLNQIAAEFPEAVWWHGDERIGFDRQVREFAESHHISHEMKIPPYEKFPVDTARWAAQLSRNREMVENCDLLVACFDGRPKGGTSFTIRYARKLGKPVRVISPKSA